MKISTNYFVLVQIQHELIESCLATVGDGGPQRYIDLNPPVILPVKLPKATVSIVLMVNNEETMKKECVCVLYSWVYVKQWNIQFYKNIYKGTFQTMDGIYKIYL